MKTFEHGGQIEKFAMELGCDVSEVIDLSSNINFVKPQINIDFNSLDISSYPVYDTASSQATNPGISGLLFCNHFNFHIESSQEWTPYYPEYMNILISPVLHYKSFIYDNYRHLED